MEKVYQKNSARTGYSYTRHHGSDEDKPLFSIKKLLIQSAVCLLVFTFIYITNFYDNGFCNAVKNEVAYTLNYTVDLESVYKSSQEVIKYLSGTLEQGKIYINSVVADGESEAADSQQQTEVYGPALQ